MCRDMGRNRDRADHGSLSSLCATVCEAFFSSLCSVRLTLLFREGLCGRGTAANKLRERGDTVLLHVLLSLCGLLGKSMEDLKFFSGQGHLIAGGWKAGRLESWKAGSYSCLVE
jgi:hypothetical protein